MVDQALLSRLNKIEADMRTKLLLNEISLTSEAQRNENGQGNDQRKLIRSRESVINSGPVLLINKLKQELQKERSRRIKMENTAIKLRTSMGRLALQMTDVNVSKRMALGVARQLHRQSENNKDCLNKFLSAKNENATLRKQLEEKRKQQNLELRPNDSPDLTIRRETQVIEGGDFTIIPTDSSNWKYEETEQVTTSDEQIYHDCQSEPLAHEENVRCPVSSQNISDKKLLPESTKAISVTRRLSLMSVQEKGITNKLEMKAPKIKSEKSVVNELKSCSNLKSIQKTNSLQYEDMSTLNFEYWQNPLIKSTSEISSLKITKKHSAKYIYDWLRENINFPLTAKYFHNSWRQWLKDNSCTRMEETLDRKLQLMEEKSSIKSQEFGLQCREISVKLLEYKNIAEISKVELQNVRKHCVELQKQLDDYKNTVDEKLRTEVFYRNKELESKLEECKKSSKEFQDQILQAERRYKDLERELENLKQESDINNHKKYEIEKEATLKKFEIDFTTLKNEYIAFKSEMEIRANEKDKLITVMAIREVSIAEERENLKKAVAELQLQSTQYLNKIKEMSTALSAQEELINEQKEIMDDKKNEITEVAQSLEISRRENRDCRENLSFLQHQLYMATNALNKLKVVSKDMQLEQNNVLKGELENTRQQLNLKINLVNANEKHRIQAQTICQMLERDLEEHKKLCSDLTEELEYYKQQNENLKQSLKPRRSGAPRR